MTQQARGEVEPDELLFSISARAGVTVTRPDGTTYYRRHDIGRFWIELELADGRKSSSNIATTVYTQPPEWLYAEGTGVPLDEDIEARIRFSSVSAGSKAK